MKQPQRKVAESKKPIDDYLVQPDRFSGENSPAAGGVEESKEKLKSLRATRIIMIRYWKLQMVSIWTKIKELICK